LRWGGGFLSEISFACITLLSQGLTFVIQCCLYNLLHFGYLGFYTIVFYFMPIHKRISTAFSNFVILSAADDIFFIVHANMNVRSIHNKYKKHNMKKDPVTMGYIKA
jgi:hypothetical protein